MAGLTRVELLNQFADPLIFDRRDISAAAVRALDVALIKPRMFFDREPTAIE